MQEVETVDIKAIIADTRALVGEGKIFAFTPYQGRHSPTWSIGVATLGESGYGPAPVGIHFPDYTRASRLCDELHGALLYSDETATAIVADTMKRSELRREQESDTVSVKLGAAQLAHALEALSEYYGSEHDSDVEDVLQDAKDELDERLGSSTAFTR